MDNMTPDTRYIAINEAMSQIRGGAYDFYIKGLDELRVQHDSVMVESCNASFQVHFQSGAREFANLYNIAMVTAGPVLAAACNSPMLMGRRLWCETRIAVFQQSVDTRSPEHERHSVPRVTFGERWVRDSVLEIYREDVARFRTLLGAPVDEDPLQSLADGVAPELRALRLHNGTVYRWIRPCYGVLDGVPHLRIENRVLPSGPTIRDEIANGAFWFGLMGALAERYEDITEVMEFEGAQMNFFAAARQGLGAQLTWIEGEELSAQKLILDRLLPLAAEGMDLRNIDEADRDLYLGIIEQRVKTGRTGARWCLQSLAGMRDAGTPGERLNALVAGTVSRQKTDRPVAEWDLARIDEGGGWWVRFDKVEQYMTTDLFTVQADEPVALVANLMDWARVRHVMVEDHDHRLLGLVTYRAVLRLLARGEDHDLVSVSEIMKTDPLTATPETPTMQAISLMRENRIACLPVVSEGKLVGVITESHFMNMSADLLRLGGHTEESGDRAS
jgi:CBS domain-containing protein